MNEEEGNYVKGIVAVGYILQVSLSDIDRIKMDSASLTIVILVEVKYRSESCSKRCT